MIIIIDVEDGGFQEGEGTRLDVAFVVFSGRGV